MVAPVVVGEHRWVVSATIEVTPGEADASVRRRTFKAQKDRKIAALETYCVTCRRSYDDAAGTICEITQVLKGGPIDTRKRRQPEPDPRTLGGCDR